MTVTRARILGSVGLWLLALLSISGLSSAALADSGDALINAVRQQDRSAIADLLRQKVDVNAPQADGATALHSATSVMLSATTTGQPVSSNSVVR